MANINFRDVGFCYSSSEKAITPILQGFNLEINGSGVSTIIGNSGIGKTTFLKLVAKILLPQLGEILIESLIDHKIVFSFVSQNTMLLPFKTIRKNLSLPAEIFKDKEIVKFALQLLDLFGIGHTADMYPSQLSVGMRARASLARALSVKPDILLIDEPFANIDEIIKNNIMKFLKCYLHENRTSAIFVTHNIMDALLFSDRIFLFTNKPASSFTIFEYDKADYIAYKRVIETLGGV